MSAELQGADLTPRRTILGPEQIDKLGEAMIALARELWVVTDRITILEAVLIEQGVDVSAVDSFQPDAALAAKLETKRKALLRHILAALDAG